MKESLKFESWKLRAYQCGSPGHGLPSSTHTHVPTMGQDALNLIELGCARMGGLFIDREVDEFSHYELIYPYELMH